MFEQNLSFYVNLLANCHDHVRDCIIMLVWRIWSLRTDQTHGKDIPPAQVSVNYLQSYMLSLDLSRRYSIEEIIKGKMPLVDFGSAMESIVVEVALPWPPPPANHVALSVDGAFLAVDGSAATSMILRRQDGRVVFAAYRYILTATMHWRRNCMP